MSALFVANINLQSYLFYQLKFFNPSISNASLLTQAGIIVGAKTAAQVITGIFWGRLADSDWGGRKTVLVVGLLSSGEYWFVRVRWEPSLKPGSCLVRWIWLLDHLRLGHYLAGHWGRHE